MAYVGQGVQHSGMRLFSKLYDLANTPNGEEDRRHRYALTPTLSLALALALPPIPTLIPTPTQPQPNPNPNTRRRNARNAEQQALAMQQWRMALDVLTQGSGVRDAGSTRGPEPDVSPRRPSQEEREHAQAISDEESPRDWREEDPAEGLSPDGHAVGVEMAEYPADMPLLAGAPTTAPYMAREPADASPSSAPASAIGGIGAVVGAAGLAQGRESPSATGVAATLMLVREQGKLLRRVLAAQVELAAEQRSIHAAQAELRAELRTELQTTLRTELQSMLVSLQALTRQCPNAPNAPMLQCATAPTPIAPLPQCPQQPNAPVPQHPNASMPHCLIAPIPHCQIAPCPNPLMPHCPVAPMPHCPIAPLPHYPVAGLPHCPIARLPLCPIAPMPQPSNAPMPHCTNKHHALSTAPLAAGGNAPSAHARLGQGRGRRRVRRAGAAPDPHHERPPRPPPTALARCEA